MRADRAWKDLVGLCGALAAVITHGSPLGADAFEVPSALPTAPDEAVGDLPARVLEAEAMLTALRDALVAGHDLAERGRAGGRLRHPRARPDAARARSPTTRRTALRASVETRLAAAASGTPRDRLRALFGGDLPGVVTFTPRDPATLTTAGDTPPTSLFGSDRLAPAAWLDAVGRTHANVARVTEVFLRREAQGRPLEPLRVAQAPFTAGDKWIATSFTGTGGRTPAGRLSVVLHAPLGLAAAAPLGGLLIDAWTETVPAKVRDTAMALHFNNASTRAPQVVLAWRRVPIRRGPGPSTRWSTVLRDTLTFTRIRMQPSTTFSRAGHMPLVYLGQRPGTSRISFSVEG